MDPPIIQHLGHMGCAAGALRQPQEQVMVLAAVALRPLAAQLLIQTAAEHRQMTDVIAAQQVIRGIVRLKVGRPGAADALFKQSFVAVQKIVRKALLAQLQKAQFQLENTVVRAPEDGYVSTVGLRPGTMSTALGMIPLMTFVPVEGAASREYVAAFRQNALQRLHKGEPAELMFPAIPGTVFRGEVADVLPAIGESQFQGQGKLLTTDALNTHGQALVVLKVTDPRFAEYALPQGATLEAAVYSDHLKELSLIRKILIRMKSWENYIYLDH